MPKFRMSGALPVGHGGRREFTNLRAARRWASVNRLEGQVLKILDLEGKLLSTLDPDGTWRDPRGVLGHVAPPSAQYALDPVSAVRKAMRLTRDITNVDSRMTEIDHLLGGHGVEPIRGDWENGYWGDVVGTYVNMGDTYSPTVMHIRDWQGVRCAPGGWGSWVESRGSRYGVR